MKKIPFDPTKELLNPFDVITKDLMRGTGDLKIVKASPEGVPLGFAKVDIVKKTVSLQEGSSKDAKTDVAYEKFEEYLKTQEGRRKFAATAVIVGENPQTLLDKIRIIIRDSQVYEKGLLLSDEPKKH